MRAPRTFGDGFDSVGPFHPFLAWAGVALVDLAAVVLALSAVALACDKIEDALWPGGPEWVQL